mmetsp:Transcript_7279/g.26655  ORF Transcript_7279/g.26655 Transcript_7279/m.26655 type:complete len:103 (-) Transcript_7279:1753-2061(-)
MDDPHYMNNVRYDRQLRIWGEHGQRKIEGCKVCVLNCGPTGSETIKNLVLAGIASYTLVDNTVVEESDLGNNFLVWFSSNFVFWPVFPCEYYRYSIKNTQES